MSSKAGPHFVWEHFQEHTTFCHSATIVLQQPNSNNEYCFRSESDVSTALIAAAAIIGADDGGLCHKSLQDSSWTTIHPSLFTGECKPASQNLFYDERSGKYFPVLTHKAFAQLLGEAVTTWKQQVHTELYEDGFEFPPCQLDNLKPVPS